MTLIIILLSLGLERFLKASTIFWSFNWLKPYLGFFNQHLTDSWFDRSWQGLILMLLPILLIVFLIGQLVAPWYYDIGDFIFKTLILIYCFGPGSYYPNRQKYFAGVNGSDQESQLIRLEKFVSATSAGEMTLDTSNPQAVSSVIYVAANRQIVAVIFWFIILGPVGAVLFRMTDMVYQIIHKTPDSLDIESEALTLRQLLEWIPARILSFAYMLVGNFHDVIKIWISYFWRGLSTNDVMLSACGVAAMQNISTPEDEHADTGAQIQFAFKMVDHAIIVLLALIAVFSLGYWIR
jgi:membrane protein required for beta-lactamase induction